MATTSDSAQLRRSMDDAPTEADRLRIRNQLAVDNQALVHWAFRRLGGRHLSGGHAEALRQELWVALLEAVDTWDPDKGSLSGWFWFQAKKAWARDATFHDLGGVGTRHDIHTRHKDDWPRVTQSLDVPVADYEGADTQADMIVAPDDTAEEVADADLLARVVERIEDEIRAYWEQRDQEVTVADRRRRKVGADESVALFRRRLEADTWGASVNDNPYSWRGFADELGVSGESVRVAWVKHIQPVAARVWEEEVAA